MKHECLVPLSSTFHEITLDIGQANCKPMRLCGARACNTCEKALKQKVHSLRHSPLALRVVCDAADERASLGQLDQAEVLVAVSGCVSSLPVSLSPVAASVGSRSLTRTQPCSTIDFAVATRVSFNGL